MSEYMGGGAEQRKRLDIEGDPGRLPFKEGGKKKRDDIVGLPDFHELHVQRELAESSQASVDARHLRVRPEVMRAQLEVEARAQNDQKMRERREVGERTERAQKVIERYREEDEEGRARDVRGEAWKYAAQKEAQEIYERRHPEVKHQEALKDINTQLTDLLEVQRQQKQDFWSFLPQKRREMAKIESEVADLRTRARIERMRIADITHEYHADLKGKRTRKAPEPFKALEPFFDTLRAPERPARTKEDERASANVARDVIRSLYKEKASLQAEREGWAILVRPFRRYAIENRLEQIAQEIKDLQEEVRKSEKTM